MPRRALVIALAALAWFAVLLQFSITVRSAMDSGRGVAGGIVIFLGYFTILTNLLVCISLTMPLIAPSSSLGKFFSRPEVTAGIAVSILFVGLAYHLLLRNDWNPRGAQKLADVLLHYVIPALYLLYWWFDSPKSALRWTHPMVWGVYPTLYLVYALIRGAILGSYPYPFIDAASIGYGQTMINSVGLLIAFIALGFLLVALGRQRGRAT
jgi:hypothetical protein